MVNFVHDEVIFEFKNDDSLQERCRHVNEVMISSMKKVIPDVAVRTEGALMERWYKEAEEIRGYYIGDKVKFDPGGDLIIWTPEVNARYEKWKDLQKGKANAA